MAVANVPRFGVSVHGSKGPYVSAIGTGTHALPKEVIIVES
jgi:hypothetical protein